MRLERDCEHEDDEQDQHDVDQRRDVHLGADGSDRGAVRSHDSSPSHARDAACLYSGYSDRANGANVCRALRGRKSKTPRFRGVSGIGVSAWILRYCAPRAGRKPIFVMPAFFASAITVATCWYFAVLSAWICSSGCGFLCEVTRSCACSAASVIGSSFQYSWPDVLTPSVIGSGGLSGGGLSVGWGRSILILCDSIGTVIMKMISSTSITSTSGVTFMSDIGPLPPPVLNAMTFYLVSQAAGTARRPCWITSYWITSCWI